VKPSSTAPMLSIIMALCKPSAPLGVCPVIIMIYGSINVLDQSLLLLDQSLCVPSSSRQRIVSDILDATLQLNSCRYHDQAGHRTMQTNSTHDSIIVLMAVHCNAVNLRLSIYVEILILSVIFCQYCCSAVKFARLTVHDNDSTLNGSGPNIV
jgi:hypothetical protein